MLIFEMNIDKEQGGLIFEMNIEQGTRSVDF